MIKEGLLASDAKLILEMLSLPKGEAMRALKLSPATVNRKAKNKEALAQEDSERLLGVAKLVGQLQAMVGGEHKDFSAETWMSAWLREPLPSLGGQRPLDFLDTMEGQALVSDTLARVESGAYS